MSTVKKFYREEKIFRHKKFVFQFSGKGEEENTNAFEVTLCDGSLICYVDEGVRIGNECFNWVHYWGNTPTEGIHQEDLVAHISEWTRELEKKERAIARVRKFLKTKT